MKALRKFLKQFGKFADPFLVMGIFVLFLIPVLTVLNLTPQTRPEYPESSVLGIGDENKVNFNPGATPQDGILVTRVSQNSDTSYSVEVKVSPQTTGSFSNDFFTASNTIEEDLRIQLQPSFQEFPDGTVISIVVDGIKFVLLDEEGNIYPPTINMVPGQDISAAIQIDNEINSNFEYQFTVDVTIE